MFFSFFVIIFALLFLNQAPTPTSAQYYPGLFHDDRPIWHSHPNHDKSKCPMQQKQQAQEDDHSCGHVNEAYLYNRSNITALDEYPWMGRISYTDENGTISYRCLGILFDKRHLIAPAHCVLNTRNLDAYGVVFGDWKIDNDINQIDCNDKNECAPQPQVFDFIEIAIHPNYTEDRNQDNDIAVLKVNRDVPFTDFVKPICLPTSLRHTDRDYDLATRLEIVGFLENVRQKTVVHTTSHAFCNKAYGNFLRHVTDKRICGFINSDLSYISSSALMGFKVINGEIQHAYLVGFLSFGPIPKSFKVPEVFIRIAPYMDWILANNN